MTQPTSGTAFGLTITRIINAPRERVFAAWTDPDHLHRWWGAHDGFTAPIVEVDLRPGGRYRFGMQDPEQAHPYIGGGEYREVNPPEKLVFTWVWEKMPLDISDWVPPVTLVTVEFFDRDGATEIVLTHELFTDEHMRDEHNNGWGGCIDRLEQYLAAL